MSTFDRMLRALGAAQNSLAGPRQGLLLAAAATPPAASERRRRSRGRRQDPSVESLERRQLLAVDVFGGHLPVLAVSGEGGDAIFIQKVATSPYSLLVADNSSFVNNPQADQHSITVPDIDSYGRILVTSAIAQADSGVQPTAAPMSSDFTTTFRLNHIREDGLYGAAPWRGEISIKQPNGDITSWRFDNQDGDDGLKLTIRSGIGYDVAAKPGQYYPTSISPQGLINPALYVTWNVRQLTELPTLNSLTWYTYEVFGRFISVNTHFESDVATSANTSTSFHLENATGLGIGPIIPESFRGVLLVDGTSYDVRPSVADPTVLTFDGATTGTFTSGDLDPIAFTGRLVTGAAGGPRRLDLSFTGASGRAGLFFPGPIELQSARYLVSKGGGDPMSLTVFAGHDLVNSLDVNLLQPGSTISIDSPVLPNSNAARVSLRATDIDLNSRVAAKSKLEIGGATGSSARAFENARPVAVVIDNKVDRIEFPAGLSGSGFAPGTKVTIEAPKEIRAKARLASITAGYVSTIRIPPGAGGSGYTAPPNVTLSPPPAGPNSRVATATAVVTQGTVTGVQITDAGSGYTVAPTVTFSSAAGSGATAIASIVGSIGSIDITDVGFGYKTPSVQNADGTWNDSDTIAVQFIPAAGYGGSGARARAIVGPDQTITQIVVTNAGSGYTPDKTEIRIAEPERNVSPDTATAEAIVDPLTARITGFRMTNKGSGYGTVPTVTVSAPVPASSAAQPVATINDTGGIASIDFRNGTGATVRVNRVRQTDGAILSVTVVGNSGGSGYKVGDLLQIDGDEEDGGVGALFKVTEVSPLGAVTKLDPVGGGGGYAAGDTLFHVSEGARGYGYDSAPRVFVDRPLDPDGKQATARAYIDAEGRVEMIEIIDPGSGYDPSLPPGVTIDELTPLAIAENINFNAGVGAQVFEISAANDPHTPQERSAVFVSATATLAAEPDNTTAADRFFAKVVTGDLFISGRISANAQSYLLQSNPADKVLQPFTMSTENQLSGAQTGRLEGRTVAITMANDLPVSGTQTGGNSVATAFNVVSLQTDVDSLRVRAARPNGKTITDPFPYQFRLSEANSISIDAVAASTFPITLVSESDMKFTSAITTAGGIQVDVHTGTFQLTAPLTTTKGRLLINADSIDLRNSISVTQSPRNDATDDIVLTAGKGDVLLNGGGVRANNRVIINQKNRRSGTWRETASASDKVSTLNFRTVSMSLNVTNDFVFDELEAVVGVTHADLSELTVTLVAPDGTRTRLIDRDATGPNLKDTKFSSAESVGNKSILQGRAPYTDTFQAFDSLAPLNGRRSRGIWTVEVFDGGSRLTGSLDSFALRLKDPNLLSKGMVAGSSRITAETLEIDAEGTIGNPALLPGDPSTSTTPGFYLRTDVNVVNARVDGSFSLYDSGSLRINALQPGGPVSLRADGVDPVVDGSGRAVVPAIKAVMTDVTVLDVSAPQGSIDIEVNTAGTLNVGSPAILSLDGSIRNAATSGGGVRVPSMRAAGSVSIRTRGGATGGDVVVRDAPLTGSGELKARYAVGAAVLQSSTYVAGTPGIYPSSITARGNQSLASLIGVSDLRVGDRLLLTGPAATSNGLYMVANPGSSSAAWRLIRAPEADTSAEFRSRSIVAVSDGPLAGRSFRIAYDESQQFGKAPIQVTDVVFVTTIGSDDPNDLLTYVVSTTDGTNTSSGSLGKMIGLRQANTLTDPRQKSEFRFSSGLSGLIRLQQELPAITKAFAIDGKARFPVGLPAGQDIVLDGSRIRTTRKNVQVLPSTTVDGFLVQSTAGDASSSLRAASLANMTLGGFLQGSAVNIQGASNILVNGMTLGVDAAGKRFVNMNGVLVSGAAAAGTTIRNCTIVGASAAGVSVQGGATGITLVGNTIGRADADNVVGIDVKSGANRIGVPPFAAKTISVGTVLGSSILVLPATAPAASAYLGQTVTGLGIAPGTVVAGVRGQSVTLSLPMTATGASDLTFETPARNTIQNNLDGIVLAGVQTTVANSVIKSNTFDGIRITSGAHFIGTSTKVSGTSNEIWGNGRWGVHITEPSAVAKSQKVIGNYFLSSASTIQTPNRAGNVGVNNLTPVATLGFVPNTKTLLDSQGNQHGGSATAGPKQPGVPVKFPWRPRR